MPKLTRPDPTQLDSAHSSLTTAASRLSPRGPAN
jgi:hypothetical protein